MVVHQNKQCWDASCHPLLYACGDRNRGVLIYSIAFMTLLFFLRCHTGFKLKSGFESCFIGNMQYQYLVCRVLDFCFEDAVKIELYVVGTNLVESESFIIANHVSVVTRNLEVYGVLNCVCKLNSY